jgi:DNA-binding GntR family transcriptional regulator
MPKKKVTSDQLDDLHDRLLDAISTGALAGGQRLIISDLAEMFDTSTNPVREALRHLQGQGLVEFETNRGARVLRGDDHAIRDTFEILRLLEPYFVSWFAEFSTPQDRARLTAIAEQIEADQHPETSHLTDLDQQFHALIADFHYNKRAVALWRSQRAALSAYSSHLPVSGTRVKAVHVEHRALLAAFDTHDPAMAAQTINLHIENAGRHLYDQLRLHAARGGH